MQNENVLLDEMVNQAMIIIESRGARKLEEINAIIWPIVPENLRSIVRNAIGQRLTQS